ncbi:hypothetical protein ABPG72_013441 [Tetrahymena utriculariae]
MLSQQIQVFAMIQQHEEQWEQNLPYKQQEIPQSLSCDELETIQEEDDDFQYCSPVEKLSQSGLMYNKRVLALDQEYLCYYQQVQIYSNKKVNTLKHKPKARILIKDIADVILTNEKQNVIRVIGEGPIVRREKKVSKNEKFSFTFRFASPQLAQLWKNIIIAAREANKQKSYLVTFEDLMKYSRSESS